MSCLPVPFNRFSRLIFWLCLPAAALSGDSGKQVFAARCAGCHGSDARGSGKAPGLAASPRLAGQSPEQLRAVIRRGFPDSGMPAMSLPAGDLTAVAAYVHDLNANVKATPSAAGQRITWGKPQAGDWVTYNGNLNANRYSELKQINTGNVANLKLKWIFPTNYFGLK